jgi:hypothetical protein
MVANSRREKLSPEEAENMHVLKRIAFSIER